MATELSVGIENGIRNIQSQHEGECVYDTIQTLLFFADGLREIFAKKAEITLNQCLKEGSPLTVHDLFNINPVFETYITNYITVDNSSANGKYITSFIARSMRRYILIKLQDGGWTTAHVLQFFQLKSIETSCIRPFVIRPNLPSLKREKSLNTSAGVTAAESAMEIVGEKIQISDSDKLTTMGVTDKQVGNLLRALFSIDSLNGKFRVSNVFESAHFDKLIGIVIGSFSESQSSGHENGFIRYRQSFYYCDNEFGVAIPFSRELTSDLIINDNSIVFHYQESNLYVRINGVEYVRTPVSYDSSSPLQYTSTKLYFIYSFEPIIPSPISDPITAPPVLEPTILSPITYTFSGTQSQFSNYWQKMLNLASKNAKLSSIFSTTRRAPRQSWLTKAQDPSKINKQFSKTYRTLTRSPYGSSVAFKTAKVPAVAPPVMKPAAPSVAQPVLQVEPDVSKIPDIPGWDYKSLDVTGQLYLLFRGLASDPAEHLNFEENVTEHFKIKDLSPNIKLTKFRTIGDGDCLIHSILINIADATYGRLNTADKMKVANTLRREILPRYVPDIATKLVSKEYLNDNDLLRISKILKFNYAVFAKVMENDNVIYNESYHLNDETYSWIYIYNETYGLGMISSSNIVGSASRAGDHFSALGVHQQEEPVIWLNNANHPSKQIIEKLGLLQLPGTAEGCLEWMIKGAPGDYVYWNPYTGESQSEIPAYAPVGCGAFKMVEEVEFPEDVSFSFDGKTYYYKLELDPELTVLRISEKPGWIVEGRPGAYTFKNPFIPDDPPKPLKKDSKPTENPKPSSTGAAVGGGTSATPAPAPTPVINEETRKRKAVYSMMIVVAFPDNIPFSMFGKNYIRKDDRLLDYQVKPGERIYKISPSGGIMGAIKNQYILHNPITKTSQLLERGRVPTVRANESFAI
jgi:hypothetical protein